MKRYKRAKLSGLQKKYYARLYRIGKLKKKAYSVAWKYKDEIRKMQKLQEQYKFLVRYDIHSLVDLVETREKLTEKRKEASAQKSRVYRANQKNKELYELAGQMKELYECEQCYQRGDYFFEEEHMQYDKLKSRLRELGYSYDEVVALKEHYHAQTVKYKELESVAGKEIRMAQAVLLEYTKDTDAGMNMEQEERKEISKEIQPKR